ncbi:unnamed protein product [Chilo suppressalis]|uniref:Peptidase S1 domain-containing protein n=1 Tax=Chilo suppressalis TaxID=168631 RepID=A0ABN8B400_CHISP|nr:unnamed protein product [Chilo suppressalis]
MLLMLIIRKKFKKINMFLFVLFATGFVTSLAQQTEASKSNSCKLPSYPKHGSYVALGDSTGEPGQTFDHVALNVTCDSGYLINAIESAVIFCLEGLWSSQITDCTRACRLVKDASVSYMCLLQNSQGKRECNDHEPDGTIVQAVCKPGYSTNRSLSHMRCIDGSWDYVAQCSAECGQLPDFPPPLILDAKSQMPPFVPWNAAIYRSRKLSNEHICGGALVTRKVVISGGHCFWSWKDKRVESPDQYVVVVGNKYRPWAHPDDLNTQMSQVSEIKVPPRFLGVAANYQEDIALVVLTTPVQYNAYVSPVCLDFDPGFEERQLTNGNDGIVAGWGKDSSGIIPALVKIINVPYLPIDECLAVAPADFKAFITSDKICVGSKNVATGICRGFGGAGLAFPRFEFERAYTKYYLRGVISSAPNTENCTNYINTVTQLSKHELFIKQQLENY